MSATNTEVFRPDQTGRALAVGEGFRGVARRPRLPTIVRTTREEPRYERNTQRYRPRPRFLDYSTVHSIRHKRVMSHYGPMRLVAAAEVADLLPDYGLLWEGTYQWFFDIVETQVAEESEITLRMRRNLMDDIRQFENYAHAHSV
ncbi:hypothetical protein M434DRAFT_373303 [Hypoxylon sp. CO27-5]|nr:hypothetical protein M434DRAFT_373303 [Hypoxylon sp. CO27-5]